jgi:hypothetical protein
MRANPLKLAFAVGLFLAIFHACWAALVYAGLAQKVLDFVFWLHFISPPFHIEAFELQRAGFLVCFTFAVGFGAGAIAAAIWNMFHRA